MRSFGSRKSGFLGPMGALLCVLTMGLAACSTPAGPPTEPTATSAPPLTTSTAAATSSLAAAPTTAVSSASAAPTAEPTPSTTAVATAAPATTAAPEAPIPNIKVANIGMHIGGGPNDAVTKAPIKASVEPYFDDLKRCWSNVDDPKKGGDFGIDLLIDKAGGKAKVSHPRTSIKGAGFKECLVTAFEKIDFKKPRGGTTMVSYSIRFTP
ncbi:MAG: hypothetical protein IPK82_15685 [Polyangiaceae bacterium]|nr:hypothetical protein [Polyangiaceae bacterium]